MTDGCFHPKLAAASASCVHSPSPSKALTAASLSCSVNWLSVRDFIARSDAFVNFPGGRWYEQLNIEALKT
jgi:hypothetical protein